MKWIRKNKIPGIFILLAIIIICFYGINGGLGYLSAQKIKFIEDTSIGAKEGYAKHGVLPSLTIAQAILESNWGKSNIENNLFGIKAGKNWTGKVANRKTKEYYNGKWQYIHTNFRAYNSFADSIKDHAKLLGSLSRYKGVLAAEDYKQAAMEVWKAGYATDPEYPQKLIQIIERYNLQKYDDEVKEIPLNHKYFLDVPEDKWYTELFNEAYEKGLIKGIKEENKIYGKPNETITRAEMLAILKRMEELDVR